MKLMEFLDFFPTLVLVFGLNIEPLSGMRRDEGKSVIYQADSENQPDVVSHDPDDINLDDPLWQYIDEIMPDSEDIKSGKIPSSLIPNTAGKRNPENLTTEQMELKFLESEPFKWLNKNEFEIPEGEQKWKQLCSLTWNRKLSEMDVRTCHIKPFYSGSSLKFTKGQKILAGIDSLQCYCSDNKNFKTGSTTAGETFYLYKYSEADYFILKELGNMNYLYIESIYVF